MTSHTLHSQFCEYYDEHDQKITLSVKTLWEKTEDNAIYTVPLSELDVFLDEDYWDDDNGVAMTPREMSKRKDGCCSYHEAALRDCSLLYPILVKGDSETLNVIEIFDGMHRLLKANLLGLDAINVKFVTAEQHDACVIKIEDRAL